MSGDRTEEDWSPEDAPDWFDAGDDDASASGESGESDSVRTGGWFDDPDHRPIETGTESTDGTVDEPADPVLDGPTVDEGEQADTPDGTAGATDEPSTEADETADGSPPESAAVADEPGAGAGGRESGPVDGERGPAAEESGPADRETVPGHESGPTGDGSDAVTPPSRSDDRGRSTTGTGDTDDTGSLAHRVLAWIRSLVGRVS